MVPGICVGNVLFLRDFDGYVTCLFLSFYFLVKSSSLVVFLCFLGIKFQDLFRRMQLTKND